MIWLEMSRDITHGGGDWSFGKCLWSPTYKRHSILGRTRQGYWENMLNIKKGDTILHLRGRGGNAKFFAKLSLISMVLKLIKGHQNQKNGTIAIHFIKYHLLIFKFCHLIYH